MAVALGIGMAIAGCSSSTTGGDAAPRDAGPMFDAAYGPPPPGDGGTDAAADTGLGPDPDAAVAPAYGPVPWDAGPQDASGQDTEPMIVPLYGVPPA